MKDYPHDEFFKYLFSIVEAVRAFLETYLPSHVLELLDLSTLEPDDTEYITPELAAIYSDKVYRCKLKKTGKKPALAAIALLEHKSFLPGFPYLQLLEYRNCIWNLFLQNNKGKPVFVLPIILYHGKKKWIKKTLVSYFKNLPEALNPYVGEMEFILVDLSKYTDSEILQLRIGFLAFGLLTMKHSSDKEWLMSQIKVVFEKGDEFLQTEEGSNFVNHLFVYYSKISQLGPENLKEKIIQNFSTKMQAATLSSYDQLILKGKLEGILEGKLEGKLEGILEGELQRSRANAEKLILVYPRWSDKKIADLSGASLEDVKAIRVRLAKSKPARVSKPKPTKVAGKSKSR